MFNDGRYWDRTLTNEFILKRLRNPTVPPLPPTPEQPEGGLPEGTRSQTWEYYDRKTRIRVAKVHQYVRPDDMIGGSGKPDPVVIFQDGVEYYSNKSLE